MDLAGNDSLLLRGLFHARHDRGDVANDCSRLVDGRNHWDVGCNLWLALRSWQARRKHGVALPRTRLTAQPPHQGVHRPHAPGSSVVRLPDCRNNSWTPHRTTNRTSQSTHCDCSSCARPLSLGTRCVVAECVDRSQRRHHACSRLHRPLRPIGAVRRECTRHGGISFYSHLLASRLASRLTDRRVLGTNRPVVTQHLCASRAFLQPRRRLARHRS